MINEYKAKFSAHVKDLQDKITQRMKDFDGEITLIEDIWSREDFVGNNGGGGITRAFEGKFFENAGVNTSEIKGKIDPDFASKLQGSSDELWAAGISLIIHPTNPKIPTVHANFRMIEQGEKFWFGGGADLTPYYPNEEDFKHFHNTWKKACAPYNCYKEMKDTCDTYFTNTHRNNEMRGIGGIFFDHFNSGDIEADFKMVTGLSNHFIESYFPIVDKRKDESFTDADIEFQRHRHGRYVEFNLLHDRGTLFGLKTKGRVDSILISLPKNAMFSYKYAPEKGSVHDEMMKYYYPRDY